MEKLKVAYTVQEVLQKSTEYFGGDELAADVFLKYALSDGDKNYFELTPDDMHHRLAKEFARIEKKYTNPMSQELIYSLLKDFKYIVPQGSPMFAIGNDYQLSSASNCFVIDSCHDSYGGILNTDQEQVQLMKRRAGVGHDLSNIRPKGLSTKNSAKTTEGISVFMERFSNSTREVAQNGRRGALMLTLNVHHLEIKTFINIKNDLKKVTGANISVKITDSFMDAVKKEKNYTVHFPINSTNPVPVISQQISAKEIWDNIIDSAWKNAEPGVLFWDTCIENTPSDIYKDFGFGSTSTNPCGEIVLSPYDSCRLLILNLYSYIINPFTANAIFDFDLFHQHIIYAQRLMDDLIDLELELIDKIINKIQKDPEPKDIKYTEINLWKKIKERCELGRRTGLGITALGDMLAGLNIIYGSKESIKITEQIYKALALASYESSIIMAKERGSFSIWDYNLEKNHKFLNRIISNLPDTIQKDYKKYGRRNIANTTTAPTGSVSILTQTTSGIEPAFSLSYSRRRKINTKDKNNKIDYVDSLGDKWQEYKIYHHKFNEWMKITGKTDEKDSPYYKGTANDIDWMASVEIQAVAQKWVCHSISKTCNLPKNVTKELVSDIYMKAWELGCKGFTIYRDGSRSGVLITEEEKKQEITTKFFEDNNAPKRPKILDASIVRFINHGEKWIAILGLFNGRPYEIFTGKEESFEIPKDVEYGQIQKNRLENGKSRYDFIINSNSQQPIIIKGLSTAFDKTYHNYSKMLSGVLRHGMPIIYVINLIENLDLGEERLDSWKIGVIRALKKFIKDGTKTNKQCLNCNSLDLAYIEGCLTCQSCGTSKCG